MYFGMPLAAKKKAYYRAVVVATLVVVQAALDHIAVDDRSCAAGVPQVGSGAALTCLAGGK
jgi:hypothetical protein